MPPLFLDEAAVRAALRMEDLIPAIAEALSELSAGAVPQPVRSVLPVPGQPGWFGVMPAIYRDIMGAKMVAFYPENGARGLHTHLAMIQIFRTDTGEPLAVMDGRLITEMRTAAASAVAVKLLAPPEAAVLAILGSGIQARSHLEALGLVRKFREIRCWSRTATHAQALAAEENIVAMDSAEAAVRGADVVLTLTSSAEPILRGEWLGPRSCVIAVGAVGPTRRELDTEAVRGASVIVESRAAAVLESGDILLAGASVYAEIGELLTGKVPVPAAGRVVYKSLGVAVEDLAAARLVLQKQKKA